MLRDRETGNPLAGLSGAQQATREICGFTIGTWLSLVERCVRDAEVAGSNPVVPTNDFKGLGDRT